MEVALKALVPIRMAVMWKFYTGNRPEKHLSGFRVNRDLRITSGLPVRTSLGNNLYCAAGSVARGRHFYLVLAGDNFPWRFPFIDSQRISNCSLRWRWRRRLCRSEYHE